MGSLRVPKIESSRFCLPICRGGLVSNSGSVTKEVMPIAFYANII